jgi:hypothetical protein
MSEKKDPRPIIQEIRENVPIKANFERCFQQGSFRNPKKPKINDVIAEDSTDIIIYYIRYLGYLYINRQGNVSPRELYRDSGGGSYVKYKCSNKNCPWYMNINVSTYEKEDGTRKKTYKITGLNDSHNEDLCFAKRISLGINDIINLIYEPMRPLLIGVNITIASTNAWVSELGSSFTCCNSTISNAKRLFLGLKVSFIKDFKLIPAYVEALRADNPGSIIDLQHVLDSDNNKRFGRVMVILDSIAHIVSVSCKPVLSMDAAFLKSVQWGKYQLLNNGVLHSFLLRI